MLPIFSSSWIKINHYNFGEQYCFLFSNKSKIKTNLANREKSSWKKHPIENIKILIWKKSLASCEADIPESYDRNDDITPVKNNKIKQKLNEITKRYLEWTFLCTRRCYVTRFHVKKKPPIQNAKEQTRQSNHNYLENKNKKTIDTWKTSITIVFFFLYSHALV